MTIDSVVIDKDTFSRSTSVLPAGQSYAASANKFVAAALGHPLTHTVMYSGLARGAELAGLTADDVNMVRMGMTGADRIAGTADDYSIALTYQATCATADVEVFYDPLVTGGVATCTSSNAISFSQPGLVVHYSKVPSGVHTTLQIGVDPAGLWNYLIPLPVSQFEDGSLAGWIVVQ